MPGGNAGGSVGGSGNLDVSPSSVSIYGSVGGISGALQEALFRADVLDFHGERVALPQWDPEASAEAVAAATATMPLESFPLNSAPSIRWAATITGCVGDGPPAWLSTIAATHSTLEHFLYCCIETDEDAALAESMESLGVDSEDHRKKLLQWCGEMYESPPSPRAPTTMRRRGYVQLPPPIPENPVPRPPVVAGTAAYGLRTRPELKKPLTSGTHRIDGYVLVHVRFGPSAPADCKHVVLFLPSSEGYNDRFMECIDGQAEWPPEWDQFSTCIIMAVPFAGEKQEGQGKRAHVWRAPLPEYLERVMSGWLVQLGMVVLVAAFGQGAFWASKLLRHSKGILRSMLLCANYHLPMGDDAQFEGAKTLLKATVPTVIIHTLEDEVSTPSMLPHYWGLLLTAPIGEGPFERSNNLTVITHETGGHGQYDRCFYGFRGLDGEMHETFRKAFAHLLEALFRP